MQMKNQRERRVKSHPKSCHRKLANSHRPLATKCQALSERKKRNQSPLANLSASIRKSRRKLTNRQKSEVVRKNFHFALFNLKIAIMKIMIVNKMKINKRLWIKRQWKRQNCNKKSGYMTNI